MKYKLIFSIILLWLISTKTYSQGCVPSTAYIELDVNNIKAGLQNTGDLWWDGVSRGKYFFPNDGSGVSAMFTGNLWMAGRSTAGNLYVASGTYPRGNTTDFWSGPLDADGVVTPEACLNWDRFFKINRATVEAHALDYVDGNIDIKRDEIYSWPARGNVFFEEFAGFSLPSETDLAPFYDKNNNGIYEPNKGEYPDIKGDQSIWWVFNDAGSTQLSTPGSNPLNVEVQVMAYAESSDIDAIDNTTFYDYKIINKSQRDYEEFFVGLFIDPDLGCYTDDYIGFDTVSHTAFVYNADSMDGDENNECPSGINTYGEEIPIVGVTIKDASFDYKTKGSFIYPKLEDGPPSGTDGGCQLTMYIRFNLIRGFWCDGLPITSMGDGINPTIENLDTLKYLYPAQPSDPDGWSMCTNGIEDTNDQRMLFNTGVEDVLSSQAITLTYAVVAVEDVPHPCPSLDKLREAVTTVKAYNGNSTAVVDYKEEYSIYPNPSVNKVNVNFTKPVSGVMKIYDISGKTIYSHAIDNNSTKELDHNLNEGFYIITMVDKNERNLFSEKLIVTRK